MEQERREVRAPDGRRVVFHVAGPEDGDLVFFHTGTPGISYIYAGLIRECTTRGLRIASVARPGYGGSDRVPGRSYADNPTDIALVADDLGAESFFSIGHSGGGGPALADAALLPGRVRAVAIGATLAPRPEMGASWREGLDEANGEELDAMEAGEPVLRTYVEKSATILGQIEDGEEMTSGSEFSRLYAPLDRECFEGEFLDYFYRSCSEARNDVDGWVDDDFAFFGDWGFDLAEVDAPVTVWQGGGDRVIPVTHAEWLAANVPGARLRLQPEDGHLSLLIRHFGAMLDELIELDA